MEDLPDCALHEVLRVLARDNVRDCARFCAAWPPAQALFELFMRSAVALALPTTVRDLRKIAGLLQLTTLDLSFCEAVQDLGPLRSCVALERLDLRGCVGLRCIAPLASCSSLLELDIGHTPVSDLCALKGLTHLRMSDCSRLSDLGPIASCSSLRTLEMARCFLVHDIEPLGSCPRLSLVDLSDTNVRDLAPLRDCRKLQHLLASGNQGIFDVSCLAACTALTRLDVSYTHVSGPLAAGLLELDVSYSDVTDLEGLTNLRSLDVSGCRIGDAGIRALASCCASLQRLSIRNCKDVEDLSPLAACPALRAVDAAGCVRCRSFDPVRHLLI